MPDHMTTKPAMTVEMLRAELLRLARYGRGNNPSPGQGVGVHSYALDHVCEKLDSIAARLAASPEPPK